jgi:hypothetical protein
MIAVESEDSTSMKGAHQEEKEDNKEKDRGIRRKKEK